MVICYWTPKRPRSLRDGTPGPEPATAEPSPEEITAAREAVNDAAQLARGLAFTFLLVGLYILILGAQTTHEQLLRAAPVQLPLLGVEVGIVQAYVLAPILYVILHANLLVQYALLNDRITAFNATIGRLEDKERRRDECHRLAALPFVALRTPFPPEGPVRWLLAAVIWTNFVIAPVVVLLWCQIRFLPYQSDLVTPWHQILLVADIAIVWFLRARLAPGPDYDNPSAPARRRAATLLIHGLALVIGFLVAVPRPLGWVLVDDEGMPRDYAWPAPVGTELTNVEARGLQPLGQYVLGEVRPFARGDGDNEPLLDRVLLIDRRLVVPGRILMQREPPPAVYARYRAEIGDDSGDEAAQRDPDHAEPLDLTDRNLRFADLGSSVLPRAQLRGSDVRSAKLIRTELPDATMVGAQLQGANLLDAQLQGAYLGDAQLQGAVLRDTSWWSTRLDGETDFAVADASDRSVEPIVDVKAWLEESVATITNIDFAARVRDRLEEGLLSESSDSQPPQPGLLDGEGHPVDGDTETTHWRPRAAFLSELACGGAVSSDGARGIVRTFLRKRFLSDEYYATAPSRLILAQRLLQPGCAHAKGADAEDIAWLERVVAEASD